GSGLAERLAGRADQRSPAVLLDLRAVRLARPARGSTRRSRTVSAQIQGPSPSPVRGRGRGGGVHPSASSAPPTRVRPRRLQLPDPEGRDGPGARGYAGRGMIEGPRGKENRAVPKVRDFVAARLYVPEEDVIQAALR